MKRGILLALIAVIVLFPAVNAQGKVTVLTSDHPADNAVARVFAKKLGATVVTTPWGELTAGAIENIVFSQATIVYVIGGEVAIPGAEDALQPYGWKIFRLAGSDRQETSQKVAREFSSTRWLVMDGFDIPSMADF